MNVDDKPTAKSAAARFEDWSPASHEVGGTVGGGSRGVARLTDYMHLRAQCPVAWTEDWGGYWTLTRFDDVRAAALDHTRLLNGRPFIQHPDISATDPIIPIALNAPEHMVYRRAMNRYFAPDRMAAIEPAFRERVTSLIEDILVAGTAEVMSLFCAPVAAQGLALLLNLPDSAYEEFLGHLSAMDELGKNTKPGESAERDDLAPDRFFAVTAESVRKVVAERRTRPLDPETDIFSGMLQLEIDGQPITDAALVGIGVAIYGAGHQTTQDGLGGALYMLAADAGLQARLRSDPALIPGAVEEFLRLDSPTQENIRQAAGDMCLQGRTIHKGDYVALNFAAANRDERQFPNAETCIVDRSPNPHLAFGHGRHKCVGAALARLEMRVALEEILLKTRSFELAEVPCPGRASQFGGVSKLTLRLVPA
jgi:cytochrome P450